MPRNRLAPLQRRILRALAPVKPPWTLTGGGALAGFHLGHRETRDLDLFWRRRTELGELVPEVREALRADGLETSTLRTAPAFAELRVTDGSDSCIVDLVAEPFAPVEPPLMGWPPRQAEELQAFLKALVDRLTRLAAPE